MQKKYTITREKTKKLRKFFHSNESLGRIFFINDNFYHKHFLTIYPVHARSLNTPEIIVFQFFMQSNLGNLKFVRHPIHINMKKLIIIFMKIHVSRTMHFIWIYSQPQSDSLTKMSFSSSELSYYSKFFMTRIYKLSTQLYHLFW